jgi:hypothetical protein
MATRAPVTRRVGWRSLRVAYGRTPLSRSNTYSGERIVAALVLCDHAEAGPIEGVKRMSYYIGAALVIGILLGAIAITWLAP